MSYVFGFLMYLLIDRPLRNIDKLILFPSKISDSFLQRKKLIPNRTRDENPSKKVKTDSGLNFLKAH